MSPRRRSRFTSWAVGDDSADPAEPDPPAGSDDPGRSAQPSATGADGDGSGVTPSLSDLLVGETPPVESAAGPASDRAPDPPYEGQMVMIPIDSVSPNSGQPRRRFEESALAALSASIAELGVLQPIIVRAEANAGLDDGGAGSDTVSYELVAGERRWRAARRAGLTHVPALVRQMDDLRSLEEAIVENLHRVDLNSLEEANAFQQLIDDFGLTQEDVATRVGKSRSAVANTLRLLQLPGSIQRMVVDGELSAGHARTLLSEPNLARQRELAAHIISEELSVRQAEELVRELSGRRGESGSDAAENSENRASDGAKRERRPKSAGALEVENRLAGLLDTRVRVTERAKSGSITIEFADAEDLDRIYRIFVGPSRSRTRPR